MNAAILTSGYQLDLEVGTLLHAKTMDAGFQKERGVTALNVLDQLERVVITSNGAKRLSHVNGGASAMEFDSSDDDDIDSLDESSDDDF